MQELLMKIISETGRPEFMLNVLKYENLKFTHKMVEDLHLMGGRFTDTWTHCSQIPTD